MDLKALEKVKDLRKQLEEAEAEAAETTKALADLGFVHASQVKSGKGKPGEKKPVKYQNPDNLEQTWAGIGEMPKWMREKLGKTRAQVKVERGDTAGRKNMLALAASYLIKNPVADEQEQHIPLPNGAAGEPVSAVMH